MRRHTRELFTKANIVITILFVLAGAVVLSASPELSEMQKLEKSRREYLQSKGIKTQVIIEQVEQRLDRIRSQGNRRAEVSCKITYRFINGPALQSQTKVYDQAAYSNLCKYLLTNERKQVAVLTADYTPDKTRFTVQINSIEGIGQPSGSDKPVKAAMIVVFYVLTMTGVVYFRSNIPS